MKKYIQTLAEDPAGDEWELKNVDSEDIGDVLAKVEKSFGFRFAKDELNEVKTFGEMCGIVNAKVQGKECDDCSSQQGFYKLREAITNATQIDKNNITPDAKIHDLFSKPERRQLVKHTEARTGFKLNILQPKTWVIVALVLLFLASLVYLFIDWKIGLGGLMFFILSNRLATITANEIDAQTVRELVNKLTRENYRKMRRNPDTINRKEITEQVKMLFSEGLALEPSALHSEATFA